MDNEAKQIAEGLPEAQRKAILNARGDDYWGYRFCSGSARGVPVELKARTIDGMYLTELGTRVRTYLEQKQ